jgi:hypothetical protein
MVNSRYDLFFIPTVKEFLLLSSPRSKKKTTVILSGSEESPSPINASSYMG